MTATLTRKGQILLPAAARRRLGLKAGARFACRVQGGQIVLTPAGVRRGGSRRVKSKVTGMIVTEGVRGGPLVTSKQIRTLLADFP
jgi:AbrB family looped-hinge helix DNA binding protein